MFCKECGKNIDDDSKFCSSCGTKQSLVEIVRKDTDIYIKQEHPNQKLNVTIPFNKPKVEIKEDNNKGESKSIEDNGKYDSTYSGDKTASVTGIIISIIYFTVMSSIRFDANADYIILGIIAIFNISWRIIATIWVVNIAEKQNRNTTGWGFFAFFIPNLALIIIGLLKKILVYSKSHMGESSLIIQNQEESIEKGQSNTSYIVNKNLKYKVDSVKKYSFFWGGDYSEYLINFEDGKQGLIYSRDSYGGVFFHINTGLNKKCYYYRGQESAVRALYHYLDTGDILLSTLSFQM